MIKTTKTILMEEVIRIGSTIIKAKIRDYFYRKRDEITLDEKVDALNERIVNLEIETESNDTEEVIDLEFETFNEAIKRGERLPPREWIIPGLIPAGSTCNIQAVEKSGKSILVTQIGHDCSYARASSLAQEPEQKASQQFVLLYDAELDDDDMVERYHDFDDERIKRCPNAVFDSPEQYMRHIENAVSNISGNVLVIADNITAICPSFSRSDIKMMRARTQKLQNSFLHRGYRLTTIFVHHTKTGSHGSGKQDSAGSRDWTRLAKLNLALSNTRFGDNFKMLSVASGRNTTSLQSDEALLLELSKKPYPHFKFRRVCKIEEAMPDKKNSKPHNSDDYGDSEQPPQENYLDLSETEKQYILDNYKPNEHGPGRLATEIFEMRKFEASESQKNTMKNKIVRLVKSKK